MSDYQRLTMREFAGITKDKIYNRLAELEDKIEAGTLIEIQKEVVIYTPNMVLIPEERGEEMRPYNEERKQVVKEFAERVKMAFYYEFNELIPSIMAEKIDELIEEMCGE